MANNVLEFIIEVKQVGAEVLARIKQDVEKLKASAFNAAAGTQKLEKGIEELSKSTKKAVDGSKKLEKGLSGVGRESKKAESGIEKLNKEIESLKSGIRSVIGAFGAFEIGKHFVDTAAEFEQYRVQLETILGSSQKAKEAFEWIRNFAKETPYQLREITEAFVRLNAYGIDGTKTLKILGDTAASMGKGLMQAVEALADAMTGEFERLKEFGIKTKATAEEVTFTWVQNGKQMAKTVKNTGVEIQNALLEIWGQRFKDGMLKQMKTFRGVLSNFFDNLTNAINDFMEKSGLFDALKKFFSSLNKELTSLFSEKKFTEFSKKIGKVLKDVAGTLKEILSLVSPLVKLAGNIIATAGPEILKMLLYMKLLSSAFNLLSAAVKGTGLKLAGFVTTVKRLRNTRVYVRNLAASFRVLASSINEIFLAFATGWEIGKWLRQFKFFRWLGKEIVAILLRIKYYAIAAFKAMTFDFSGAKQAIKELDEALKINEEAYRQIEEEVKRKNEEQKKGVTLQRKETEAAEKTAQEKQKAADQEQKLNTLREEGLKLEEELKKAVEEQRRLKEELKQIEEDRVSFVRNVEDTIADIRRSKLIESLRYADMYDEAWRNIYKIQSVIQKQNFQEAQLLYERTKQLIDELGKSNVIPEPAVKQTLYELQDLYKKFVEKSAFKYVAEAEEEAQRQNFEEAKRYLVEAKKLFEDMARSYDELTSKKGFKGLELVKEKYEEIAKVQKEQVEKKLETIQEKIDALKEALSEVTEQYQKLSDKDINITIDSNINEIINYWENIRDKTVTLTIQKREVEAHRTGGLVGIVPGGWGGGDKVHALLEPGEFVIRKEAVARFGAGFFHALNSLKLPKLPATAKSIAEKTYKKFVISIAGAELEGFSTKEALAEFEKQLRRKRLRLA